MKFYRETLELKLAGVIERAENYRKDIKNVPQESDILWEVAEVIEHSMNPKKYSLVSWMGKFEISCVMPPTTPTDFEELLDDLDEVFEANGYTLDLDHENPLWRTGQEYHYITIADDDSRHWLKVVFSSTECKTIPTGRMVPETKNECILIKI